MSIKSKFVIFVAVPTVMLTLAGVSASAFTFGSQSISSIAADKEVVKYLVPATEATSLADSWTAQATLLNRTSATKAVSTKYGELPQWSQVSVGNAGVPSTVQEAGDLLFINARSSTMYSADNNNGNQSAGAASAGGSNSNVVSALYVKGNITNVAQLREVYQSCLIPIRLWSTTDLGVNWDDVTSDVLATEAGEPYYIDCDSGHFAFTVDTAATAYGASQDLDYVVTVEKGGNFATMNANDAAEPEFVFVATPISKSY